MAASIAVTFPAGVVTPRAQVHPVLVTLAGLTPGTAYSVVILRPAGSQVSSSIRTTSEKGVVADPNGNASLIDVPQVSGVHTLSVNATPPGLQNVGGSVGVAFTQPAALASVSYTAGS